jgi:transposase
MHDAEIEGAAKPLNGSTSRPESESARRQRKRKKAARAHEKHPERDASTTGGLASPSISESARSSAERPREGGREDLLRAGPASHAAARSSAQRPREGGREDLLRAGPAKIVRATMRMEIDLRKLSAPTPRGQARVVSEEETETRRALADVARKAVTAANVIAREIAKHDTEVLDRFILEHGRKPKNAQEWPRVSLKAESGLNLYALGRRAAPELASGIVATIAYAVSRKWNQERWATCIHETRSPPHFRAGQPFSIRRQDFTVGPENEGTVDLAVALYANAVATKGKGRYRLPLSIKDTRQKEVIEKLVTGSWKTGELKIEQDRLRPQKWYARISYTRIVDLRTGGIKAAINRGIRNFLVMVAETGDREIHDGNEIEAFLKQIQARRRSYQRQIKRSSRIGHGRRRALEPIVKLEDKATRWRKTRNQTLARRCAIWLRDRGVTTLYLEDFTAIRDSPPEKLEGGQYVWERIQEWPYYDLGQRITACVEEYGIEVTVLMPENISRRCPKCGHIALENKDLERWRLRCTACRHSEHLDVAACQNLLARGAGTFDPDPSPNAGLDLSTPKATQGARKRKRKEKKITGES